MSDNTTTDTTQTPVEPAPEKFLPTGEINPEWLRAHGVEPKPPRSHWEIYQEARKELGER